ncbi:metallophosphoesterase family protein [Cognatilysobacter bugurensis]|uniref:Phosphoesterase n=1 Tax=Cognatilysobacter bugurensis TaxID=543356 RepID=A0A918W8F6_9GAMM|nr:metallophosphoesterase family protein [Lysobacter bugurensis]GHA76076.1 phosphoesterase [Lysobacter bugurensis]
MRIGLISDTHGLLRPEALHFLRGSDAIIHGGDIGPPDLLDALRVLAPLTVVRGNNDTAPWARSIEEACTVDFDGRRVHVLHDLKQLALHPEAEDIAVVVTGHTHKPLVRRVGGVIYINPGSAGPRRFSLPIAVGELVLRPDGIDARTVELDVPPARAARKTARSS